MRTIIWIPMMALVMALAALGACGNGTPDNGPPDASEQPDAPEPDASEQPDAMPDAGGDGVAPAATIVYPSVAGVTDTPLITVRGTASDSDGVAAVRVNGVLAASDDGFARWQATVPLNHGINDLVVETEDVFGIRDAAAVQAAVHLSADPAFHVTGMDMDPVARLIWLADSHAGVLVLDPANGERTIISGLSGSGPGSGPALATPTAVVWDALGARALVTDSTIDAVVAVTPVSGARAIVSDSLVGGGPELDTPAAMAFDAGGGRLVVADTGLGALVSIDPSTGARAIISDAAIGTGPALGAITALVIDGASNRALVAAGAQIMAVDLGTGDRTVVSDDTSGGPALTSPSAIMLDEAGNQALVVDAVLDALIAVDLATGFRIILSDASTGGGPTFQNPGAALLDPANTRVLLADRPRGNIVAVELGTGVREVVSRFERGSGVQWDSGPGAAAWDVVNRRAYVVNDRVVVDGQVAAAVMAVNLASGARTVVTDSREGPALVAPSDIMVELGRLIIADAGAQSLFAVNLATTNATHLSGGGVGTGPEFWPSSVALDSLRSRLLSVDADQGWLFAIERLSGNRSVLSSPTMGTGPDFVTPAYAVVDSPNLRALVTDTGADAVVAVHLVSGNRTVLSAAGTDGVVLSAPAAAALDPVRNRLVVTTQDGVVAVDLATGGRSLIAGASAGYGPLSTPGTIAMDPETGLAVVTDPWYRAVTVIDTVTGDRMIVSR